VPSRQPDSNGGIGGIQLVTSADPKSVSLKHKVAESRIPLLTELGSDGIKGDEFGRVEFPIKAIAMSNLPCENRLPSSAHIVQSPMLND
jgi:hypothetical protein